VADSGEPLPATRVNDEKEVREVSPRWERVRVPETYPRERVVLGELHLLRGRLDEMLGEVAGAIERSDHAEEGWLAVEEATRLARRALVAAASAVPPLSSAAAPSGALRVGELRVDRASRRQWYGEAEFELTPLHHRLLAVMAADPFRVFGKDELLVEVWGRGAKGGENAVKMSVSRVRRALVAAGAPQDRFMISLYGVGWALTRPT
jgi:DNA-binding response OmpR family regulator